MNLCNLLSNIETVSEIYSIDIKHVTIKIDNVKSENTLLILLKNLGSDGYMSLQDITVRKPSAILAEQENNIKDVFTDIPIVFVKNIRVTSSSLFS